MDKIVLIEDDPGIRTVIRLALKGAGFASVCEADNGADGLALVLWEKPAARSTEEDVVRGLELGADDYITKPFSKAILVARIKAALRRTSPPQGPVHTLGSLVIDETSRKVSVDGIGLSLTRSEFDLLNVLVVCPGRVYTRQLLIERIQREEKDVTERTIDTLMVGLRRKLGEWAAHIETIRGIGYRITP